MNLYDFIMNTEDDTLIRVYKIGRSINMPFADAALPEEHISNMPEETKNLSVCFWGNRGTETENRPNACSMGNGGIGKILNNKGDIYD